MMIAFQVLWTATSLGFSTLTASRLGPIASVPWLLGFAAGFAVTMGLMLTTVRPVTYRIGYCYAAVVLWWRRHHP